MRSPRSPPQSVALEVTVDSLEVEPANRGRDIMLEMQDYEYPESLLVTSGSTARRDREVGPMAAPISAQGVVDGGYHV